MEEEHETDERILGANRAAAASRVLIPPVICTPLPYRILICGINHPCRVLNLVLTPASDREHSPAQPGYHIWWRMRATRPRCSSR